MKKRLNLAASAALISFLAAPAFGQEAAPTPPAAPPETPAEAAPLAAPALPAMSAHDLVTMPALGAPIVSADGRFALYTITTTSGADFKKTTTPYILRLDNPKAEAKQLDLKGEASAYSFGADGALYFLSSRDASYARLWKSEMTADGSFAAPKLALDAKRGIDGYKLAPNAKKVAVWALLPRNCSTFACVSRETDAKNGANGANEGGLEGVKRGSARLYEGDVGFYRHWDTWKTPGSFNRSFVFSLEETAPEASPEIALDGPAGPDGINGNTPTMPFGGADDIAWSADSAGVWFTMRLADKDEPRSTNLDIYWNDLSGAAPTNITAANLATDLAPSPSPDGRTLAYLAMERAGYEADRQVIHLRDLETGQERALTAGTDLSFTSISWTADSRFIISSAQEVLDTPAFKIDVETGAVEKLDLVPGNEAHIGAPTLLANGAMLFTRDTIAAPADLYYKSADAEAVKLTDVSGPVLGARRGITTTRFSFIGAGGDTVWGQITKPEGASAPLPAILYVHGGPQGSFNDGWSKRWNPRVTASQGYAVISVDFHGSTGYGQAFTDAIGQDWGGKPLEDLQKGLEAALKLDPAIDGSRACAMGASYGGYMMNWIAGNWPDRFKCLVQHDGIFDTRAFYYETEETWFPRWDFGGSYAAKSKIYEKWNPVNFLDNWNTPMLVITGEKDFRISYAQGLSAFTALQEREIPSQLLVFPDENHWVLKPANSLQWHETVFAWLKRWLKGE